MYVLTIFIVKLKLNRSLNHLKSLLKDSILNSSSVRAGKFLDFLFTFYTCHSLLKCCLWSWAVPNTADYPQLVHFIVFSSFYFCSFFGFSGFTSSSSYCYSFSLKPYISSSALNCSFSRPLFYSLKMTPTNT